MRSVSVPGNTYGATSDRAWKPRMYLSAWRACRRSEAINGITTCSPGQVGLLRADRPEHGMQRAVSRLAATSPNAHPGLGDGDGGGGRRRALRVPLEARQLVRTHRQGVDGLPECAPREPLRPRHCGGVHEVEDGSGERRHDLAPGRCG